MTENHIYAGSPAKDVTDKMGCQFRGITLLEKERIFSDYVAEYKNEGNDVGFIETASDLERIHSSEKIYFNFEDFQKPIEGNNKIIEIVNHYLFGPRDFAVIGEKA